MNLHVHDSFDLCLYRRLDVSLDFSIDDRAFSSFLSPLYVAYTKTEKNPIMKIPILRKPSQ